MSECCVSSTGVDTSPKRKHPCPVCSEPGNTVAIRTMLLHISEVWRHDPAGMSFYFCRTQDCDVIYFSDCGELITKDRVRISVGIKETDVNALLCYCFGVSKKDVVDDPSIRQFVINQTKLGNCACETANPSGRCCLKDFPKLM